ncbi:hypothetical protein QYE76_026531 [Lolium multiflorum]|uniref:F-box domain-containing protein n=1 Tax=Lolium multiflorum TaxID=4521 RepID=A0AAD8RJU1_LOLMU|nr:hypothetical protein QYE76_026531 [Lolium multiflorum]
MLPNDVLLNILDRLDTLDAIRTCVVSTRTQYLPTMLSQIVIVLGAWELHRLNDRVVEVTDKILTTRSPQIPIRKLKLRFIMRGDDHLRIGRSVALAMASHKIDAAEFEVMTKRCFHHGDGPDPLYFAQQFNGFIRECPDAFAGLTRLYLQNLRFDDVSDIPNILIACKQLESLCFFRCDTKNLASVLRVEHARLLELDINFGQLLTVELTCLPKLQRVRYNTWFYAVDPLVLLSVPQLSKMTLSCAYGVDITLKLSEMLANVHTIDNLELDFQSQKVLSNDLCLL